MSSRTAVQREQHVPSHCPMHAKSSALPNPRTIVQELHINWQDGGSEERALAWQKGWRFLNGAIRNLRSKCCENNKLVLYNCALFLWSSMRDTWQRSSFPPVSNPNRLSASIESNITVVLPIFIHCPPKFSGRSSPFQHWICLASSECESSLYCRYPDAPTATYVML